jgi:hypothetical protein
MMIPARTNSRDVSPAWVDSYVSVTYGVDRSGDPNDRNLCASLSGRGRRFRARNDKSLISLAFPKLRW